MNLNGFKLSGGGVQRQEGPGGLGSLCWEAPGCTCCCCRGQGWAVRGKKELQESGSNSYNALQVVEHVLLKAQRLSCQSKANWADGVGGYFYNFQHFQSFIMHSLHWAMHGVWFENQPRSILILDEKQKPTQFIWATPAPEHLSSYTVCGAHCILSHGPASPDIVINVCLLISIFWA